MRDLFDFDDTILTSKVQLTDIDKEIFKNFDYKFDGKTEFVVPHFPTIQKEFSIGVIYGSSGSGKSSMLKQFGDEQELVWDYNKTIASHFDSVEDAIERLGAVGLNTVPTWAKPRNVLSNGEGFRCDLARRLGSNIVIDEFTSVVNRDVAKSCSLSLYKYVKRKNLKNIVLATCHDDILEWLQPDWVFNTDVRQFASRGLVRQPIEIRIVKGQKKYWELFKKHHYLTEELPSSVQVYLALWGDRIVGFSSTISLPGWTPPLYEGDKRLKWREARTVVLPDFQGLGIGTRISDAVGEIMLEQNVRYYSKTSHIRMGEYREKSPLWRATVSNLKDRSSDKHDHQKRLIPLARDRICYSHEYIGINNKSYDPKYNRPDDGQMSFI
jgi:ABC-type lipoprotein export system ATPase subunit/GNAT superfamily N-acetyltransferase